MELPEALFAGDCPLGGTLPVGFPAFFNAWEENLEPESLEKVATAILDSTGTSSPAATQFASDSSTAASGGGGGGSASSASNGARTGPATPAGRRLVSRVAMLLGIARQAQGSEDAGSEGRRGMSWAELWRVLTAEAEP